MGVNVMSQVLPEGFVVDPVNDQSLNTGSMGGANALPDGFVLDDPSEQSARRLTQLARVADVAAKSDQKAAELNVDVEAQRASEAQPDTNTFMQQLLNFVRPNQQLRDSLMEIGSGKEAFQRGMAQGATFGFADELSGAVRGAANTLTGEGSLGENYRQARDESRARTKEVSDENPVLSTAGEVAGSLAAGLPAAPQVGAGWLANTGRLAGVGAVEGGLAGLGASEADLAQGDVSGAATDTAVGAGIGAVASPVIGGALDLIVRGVSRLPIGGWRLQGDAETRAANNLADYLKREYDAGRISPEQVQAELNQLRSGAADDVEFSLADLDAFQELTAYVNRRAGSQAPQTRPAVDSPDAPTETTGTIREQLSGRQGRQQEGIQQEFSPDRSSAEVVDMPVGGRPARDETLVDPDNASYLQRLGIEQGLFEPVQVDGKTMYRPRQEPVGDTLPGVGNYDQPMAMFRDAYDFRRAIQQGETIPTPRATGTDADGAVRYEIDTETGMLNIPMVQRNMRQELNDYTSGMYDTAYSTPVRMNELPSSLRDKPSFKEAYKAGSNAAKDNTNNPSMFQRLDYTKRELDRQIRSASGGRKADLVEMRNELTQFLTSKSPEYQSALSIQDTYRNQVINQFDRSANYFNMDEVAAANTIADVAEGNLEIARESIGQQIRQNLRGARNEDGSLLTPQQIDNYERLLDADNWGNSRLRNMIGSGARTERTRRLADITQGKGLGAEAESALRDVLGQNDLAVSTIVAAIANPTLVALPWMVNRGIASEAAKVTQQQMFRELQRTLYSGMSGSDREVKQHLDNIFSFQFEKVPADTLREFINVVTVGSTTGTATQDALDINQIER